MVITGGGGGVTLSSPGGSVLMDATSLLQTAAGAWRQLGHVGQLEDHRPLAARARTNHGTVTQLGGQRLEGIVRLHTLVTFNGPEFEFEPRKFTADMQGAAP